MSMDDRPAALDALLAAANLPDEETATAKARAAIAPLAKAIRTAKAQERAKEKADTLEAAAQQLYTALFPAVYDDLGQKAAEGVNRAVGALREMARQVHAEAYEPASVDQPTLAGAMQLVESWFVDVNDGHGLDASDLVHQLQKAGYRLPSDGPS